MSLKCLSLLLFIFKNCTLIIIAQKDIYIPARMPQCSTEEIPEKTNKKKRWWGDLFRRSSKARRKPSDSSSDEEDNRLRGFLGRKRHSDRGSKDVTNSFLINPGLRDVPRGRSLDSVKSPERSSKRRIKAKVEASRELLRDSSSDEASSYTSSLQSGGSFPRRSRAARTERHIRRLSRDLELQNNTAVNKSKWSANIVYQECKEYDRKYRAKARSATPSPAQSPKVKRPAGRATSFDNIKSSPPPPPPRKLPEQRPLSLETPMRTYNPPVFTTPPQPRSKARYQHEYVSESWLPTDQSPEEAKKPPAAPPRRQISSEERRRQQNNLEEALNELEAIYKKLASEDGQDNQSEMSEDKRPLEDDMAYRRLNRREPSSQDVRELMSQAGSYLLVSPTLSPPPITPHSPVSNGQEPDIISDDVVYRTMQHTNNTLKISDPQPPFGIPLGPISPSPPSDYLHVEAQPRFDHKPSKLPDVVRDDLAFRNLRKDSRELKKKKAVRSLSANLTNLIRNNNNFNIQNNNLEGKSHSFQDIPEELRVSEHMFNLRKTEYDREEANKRYLSELCASENDLLRELEEEARATSVQLDEELRQLSEQQTNEPSVEALYSRSMTDLLKELTKNLDYDFGFNEETHPVVVASCQTCETQSTKQTDNCLKPPTNSNSLIVNNNRRLDIAESRRKFFESPDFNKKIERESFADRASPRVTRNGREYEKDNPFSRYYRSPSNPESHYNEKYINGHEFRSSRSPMRTTSADSSGSKENMISFIERPFSRTSRSPTLESSRSFNEKYSPRMSRNPFGSATNGKPKSFSNERDFLDREVCFDQLNRYKMTRSPVNLLGKEKQHQEYGNSEVDGVRENSIYDLRQRLKSPVEMDVTGKSYSRMRSPAEFCNNDSTSNFVETYRQIYKNDTRSNIIDFENKLKSKDSVQSELFNKKNTTTNSSFLYNTIGPFDSNSTSKTRTNSEDSGYYKSSSNDFEKEMSRSFDSDLLSFMRQSPDQTSFKRETNSLGGEDLCKPLNSSNLIPRMRGSPGLEALREIDLESKETSSSEQNVYALCTSKSKKEDTEIKRSESEHLPPFVALADISRLDFEKQSNTNRISLSPVSVEAVQKRKSFAGSSDTHVDEQYPREVEKHQQHLRPSRTPIDLEAIEKDSTSCEPSPQHSTHHPGDGILLKDEGCSSSVGVVSLAAAHSDVTSWREEESKQEECGVVGRCENGGPTPGSMVASAKHGGGGGMNDGREERMARYKEERRRQLAAQFGPREGVAPTSPTAANIRSTRASRLRTQANSESFKNNKDPPKEEENCNGDSSSQKKEKDKSCKRKSNLNKSSPADGNHSQQSSGESCRRRTMVSPKLSRICSPKSKKTTNSSSSSSNNASSPVPKSSQLVQRHVNRTAQDRVTPSDSSHTPSPVNRQISRVRASDKVEASSSPPSVPQSEMPSPVSKDAGTSVSPVRLSSLLVSKSTPSSPAKHPSILKKSSLDEPISAHPPTPVSILKRKTSQDEANTRCSSPVRFSSDVIEKKSNRGILKKHRSLDDPQVGLLNAALDTYFGPDQDSLNCGEDTRSILKPSPSTTPPPHQPLPPQRRCSLEEVVRRTLSPEPQGILKRKASREEVDQHHQHEITPPQPPPGILKKKSFSCDETASEMLDSPRPILKKKSSSEEEEHHVKPILKTTSRKSIEEEGSLCKRSNEETIKPILKHSTSISSATQKDEVVLRVKRNPLLSAQQNRVVSLDLGELLQRQAAAASGEPSHSPPYSRPRPLSIAERISDLTTTVSKSSSRMEETNGKLERSGSVSETASIFAQLEQREKAAAEAAKCRRATRGLRNRGKLEGGVSGRFCTQPVTSGEVEQAKRNNDPECDDADPSKLSLAERVALFSRRSSTSAQPPPVRSQPPVRRVRHSTEPTMMTGNYPPPTASPLISPTNAPPPSPKRIVSKSMSGILVEGLMKNLAQKGGATPPKLKIRTEDSTLANKADQDLKNNTDSDEEDNDEDASSSSTDSDDGEVFAVGGSDSGRENKENREVVIRRRSAVRRQRVTSSRGGLFPLDGFQKEVVEETSSEETSSGGREVSEIIRSKYQSARVGVQKSSSEVLDMLAGSANGGGGEVTVALRRCATQHMHSPQVMKDEVDELPKLTIAERLAALKEQAMASRIICSKPPPVGGVSRVSERLGQLETASQTWRSRVEQTDEVQFTVAGKMGQLGTQLLPPLPQPNLYKSDGIVSASTPSVPNSLAALMKRSISVTEGEELENGDSRPSIQVPAPYDDSFAAFFTKAEDLTSPSELDELGEINFEDISNQSTQLLVQRRNVRVQRKHRSTNPVKALAARNDLKSEYVEVKTGVADREIRRINIEKLSKSSGFAMEALAGLASKEDLSAVSLKKPEDSLPGSKQWPRPLLIRLKGRRHGVTSLVACHYTSVNQGDSYVLVTDNQVFHWIGEYCNIIEKSRGTEVAQAIQSKKDLGCTGASEVYTLEGGSFSEKHRQFWRLLSLPEDLMHSYKGEQAGPPNEDEIYEVAIAETFAVYAVENALLVPVKEYWGRCPKTEVLDPNKVLVFDFGTEVYMWAGKQAEKEERRQGHRLAQEVFKKGYRSDSWHPTGIAWLDRQMSCRERPSHSVYCKTIQHMEPVLFKEKFLNWPDFGRVIRVSSPSGSNSSTNGASNRGDTDGSVEARPCDVESMLNWKLPETDLVIEGTHLGRGKSYYDPERRLLHEVTTEELAIWQIRDYTKTSLDPSSFGVFHEGECYIIYWKYVVSITGREISGAPSRHGVTGRERILYTTWQGNKAPVLEQGAAALLAVDQGGVNNSTTSSAQALVCQGQESPAFVTMLPGPCVILAGFRDQEFEGTTRMFLCTGDSDDEGYLEEVLPQAESLRSKASIWLLDVESGMSYLWHGNTSLQKSREVAQKSVSYLVDITPTEFGVGNKVRLSLEEIEEGEEPEGFLGGCDDIDRSLYNSSLLHDTCEEGADDKTSWSLRMYHLTSLTGEFTALPVIPYRYHPDLPTAYPYRQEQLYDVSQPGLLVIDGGDKLWLWCGWWESGFTTDTRGSAWCRHLAERRAAMTSCLDYWAKRNRSSDTNTSSCVFVVWAGLEPVQFSSLFPVWDTSSEKYNNARQFNIEEGHFEGEMRLVEDELAKERKTYPVSELTSHPLPAGVDPTRLELYLQIKDFNELLGMSKEEFHELPNWKRTNLKKKVGLF
ncbi:uncharacterized protein isoform X4 [Rhodnius prolixus]|uniref:uncharacterized protein isoform X4 n=1 Tax=Rhodnius prolixus TaxID=13249 RepID=UPI003D18CBC9